MFRATFLAAAMALVLSAPAGAATYQVAGKQTAVDADAGTYKMSGGLRGDWAMTSFEEVATEPYYEGKGTEVFDGCIDRGRDRSCSAEREPAAPARASPKVAATRPELVALPRRGQGPRRASQ